MNDIERHPLLPFLPEGARILFLGSFPPPRHRWRMDFFYPNWVNDHWRIEGLVFYDDANHFLDLERKTFRLDLITEHCRAHGLAFFDTATAVRRQRANASDMFLEVVEPTDIDLLTSGLPQLRALVTTGGKATLTLCQTLGLAKAPQMNEAIPVPGRTFEFYRLPSSSRAYPMPLEEKAAAYRQMFNRYLHE